MISLKNVLKKIGETDAKEALPPPSLISKLPDLSNLPPIAAPPPPPSLMSRLPDLSGKPDLPPVGVGQLTPDTMTPQSVPFNQRTGEMLPPLPLLPVTSATTAPDLPPIAAPLVGTRPRVAGLETPITPDLPPVGAPLSQQLQHKLAVLDAKDYSKAKYDANGNLIKPAGADRDKKWSDAEKAAAFGLEVLKGVLDGKGVLGSVPQAIKGATNRNYFEQQDDRENKARLGGQYNEALEMENNALKQDYERARTATIPIDDENKRLDIKARQQADDDRLAAQALGRLSSLKHFDPNNRVHKQLAEKARLNTEDLQGWDDRNPIEKMVAGVQYRLNRATGQYEPTNLPADESKAVTDYKVTMPNGEVRTYKVSQRDAASFSTQMTALGARLEQQQKQFEVTTAQRDKQFQATYGLAKERIGQAAAAFKLAQEKFEYAKQRGDKLDPADIQEQAAAIKAQKLALIRTKADIMNDKKLTADEKSDLLLELAGIE